MFESLFTPFKKPMAKDLAKNQYEEFQRKLLEHEDAHTYHQNMVQYYQANIQRLSGYLKKA